MADENQYIYVSDTKLQYYTQQLKAKFATLVDAAIGDVIDDTKATTTNIWSAKKIQDMINGIVQIKLLPVDTLPTKGEVGTIYLVPNAGSAERNIKDEYVWYETNELEYSASVNLEGVTASVDETVAKTKLTEAGSIEFLYDGSAWIGEGGATVNLADYGITITAGSELLQVSDVLTLKAAHKGAFEKIGTTEIDLTPYVKHTEMVEITEAQIDTIFNTVWPTTTE